MNTDTMIKRSNSIADYFKEYSHDRAVSGIQNHLKNFWEERQLSQLINYVKSDGKNLDQLVIEAVNTFQ